MERFLNNEPGKNDPDDHTTCCYHPGDEGSEEWGSKKGGIPEGETDDRKAEREEKERKKQRNSEMGNLQNCWEEMNSDAGWLWKRWRLGRFMESPPIRGFFISLVCLNGILLGVQVQTSLHTSPRCICRSPDPPYGCLQLDNSANDPAWAVIEAIFIIVFSVEIGLKLVAFKAVFWYDYWNIMDFAIVAVSVLEILLGLVAGVEGSGLSAFRLIRILRVIRVVSFVERLNTIVEAFVRAMKSVGWVGVLLTMAIYMFAILARSLFGSNEDIMKNQPQVAKAFGTIPRSMISLVQVMTFDAWASELMNPILSEHPVAAFFFMFFIVLVALGLLNLLTGVFLKALMDLTEEAQKKQGLQKSKAKGKLLKVVGNLFQEFDADAGGTLDDDELPILLERCTDFQEVLDLVGLPQEKLQLACEIADWDHSRRIYDASTETFYHEDYKPLPNSLESSDTLFRDVTCPQYRVPEEQDQMCLPEGVMEGELLECLLTMDQPLCRSDYFRMMKKLRFMEQRQQNVEDNVSEILELIKGGASATGKKAVKASKSVKQNWTDKEFEAIVQLAFGRYDFDGSGSIDSAEELEQLTLNLVYKLKLKPPEGTDWGKWARSNTSTLVRSHGTVDHDNAMNIDVYIASFKDTFLSDGGDAVGTPSQPQN